MLPLILPSQEIFITLLAGTSLVSVSVLLSFVQKHGLLWILLYPWTVVKQRVRAYRFLLDAPRMIQDGYDAANGDTYVVDSPDVRFHIVSDKTMIEEIDRAPHDVLSLQAAAKILLKPEYSMHGFDWFEQRGVDGTPLVKTLQTLLRNELPSILPKTRMANSAIMDDMMSSESKRPHFSTVIRACVSHINARAFFGEEFAQNKKFIQAAEDFVDKTVLIAEADRLLPGFIGRPFTKFLESRFSSQHVIFNALVPVAQKRIDEFELSRAGHIVPEHKDCIQWVMEQSAKSRGVTTKASRPWTASRITHELIAVWFGAVHTMAMATTYAVRDLCLHPEYVDALRKELESPAYQEWEAIGNGLPLLDSFLKESARTSPIDNVSTRRKALKPFTLSNGMHVKKGEWLATPLVAMLRDSKNWADPLSFHGFRHVDAATLASLENGSDFESPEPEKASSLTDTSRWQTWGTGRMACPGRFYATAGIKQIVSLMLTKYDLEMTDRCAPATWSWRTCNVPRADMPIVLRPRTMEG